MNKYIFFILFILAIYLIALLPGIKGGNDLPYSSITQLRAFFELPSAWGMMNGVFGQNHLSTLWAYPSGVLYSLGAILNLDFGLTVTLFGILPVILVGFWSMDKFSSLYLKDPIVRGVAATFFLINSYILLILDGGQLLWAMAYAFLPYCFYRIELKFQTRNFQIVREDLLSFVLLSFCDLRVLYLFAIWFSLRIGYQLIFFIRQDWSKLVYFTAKFAFLLTISLIFVHSYWIIPLLFTRANFIPDNLTISSSADFLQFTSLGHALFLQQPHWFKNIFGEVSALNPWFAIIPVLVFFPLILKKNKSVGFLMIMALIGIFLAKGTQPPFGFIFEQSFKWVPGFFLFRDSTKFLVLVCISYSILFAYTIQFLLQIKTKVNGIRFGVGIVGVISLYLLILYSPVFTNQMTGLFSRSVDYENYVKLDKTISHLPQGKVLWVSSKPPLAYSDPDHLAVNAVDLISLRPFATGIKGTYETLNFLREASYSGELLKIAGIGYLGYAPLNPSKNYKIDQIQYHQLFYDQLSTRFWTQGEQDSTQIPILKLNTPEKLFFIPENSYFVVGSDKVYQESTKSAEASLSNQAFIFTEEKKHGVNMLENARLPILLYKTTQTDLIMNLAKNQPTYFPAANLTQTPDSVGWWKTSAADFLKFKDFLFNKYGIVNQDFDLGEGFAIAEGEKSLIIPLEVNKGDHLFIRAMESTRSGTLILNQLNQVPLQKSGDQIHWLSAGIADQNSSTINLKTSGDITIINAIKVISAGELVDLNQQASKLVATPQINLQNVNKPEVHFTHINDSKYVLTIKGVKKPTVLVFAQSYDPKWQLNGKSAVPVYSIFNGFIVDHDGEYQVLYEPEKFMLVGIVISVTSLLVLLGSVVYRYYGYKRQ